VAATTGTFRLGPDNGRIVLKTSRAGFAAKAGHDLTIEVTRWSAQVEVPGEDAGGVTAAQVTAELDLGSLAVLEGTGGAKPLSDKDRRDILNTAGKILGRGTARFTSSRIIPAASGGAIEGTLTLGGVTRPARLQLVSRGPGQYRGTATVRQTDHGITPYTGFFGALKLKDEVTVEVEADLTRAAREK
jgi:polyisoprenoid-binding protein YceI